MWLQLGARGCGPYVAGMSIHVYNTAEQRKVALKPLVPGRVSLYVCGPTVYDYVHLGNGRPLVVFDVLVRHLRHRGYSVRFVRNVTDIDDKIIARAAEAGQPAREFAEHWAREFRVDCALLGCADPNLEPRATDHIPQMVEVVRQLVGRGLAYEAQGSVYMSAASAPGYGELSRMPLSDLRSDPGKFSEGKRDPADFALWKAAKPGEPCWPSPWGQGRPGWHLECSAMAGTHLGHSFDIHGGGIDLLFPHHECERAQTWGVHGVGSSAQLWMHNGFVGFRWVSGGATLAEGTKISKSDPATRPVAEALALRSLAHLYGGEVVRLWLLTAHYRHPMLAQVELAPGEPAGAARVAALEEAHGRLAYAYATMDRLDKAVSRETQLGASSGCAWLSRLEEALDDDLNTPAALAAWEQGLAEVNRTLDAGTEPGRAWKLRDDLRWGAGALGLCQQPAAFASRELENLRARRRGVDLEQVADLVRRRGEARSAKDWALADAIRQQLRDVGVEVLDGATGTSWRLA